MNTKLTEHTEDHDEGYFASFTDLLVGILFIFIIMLMMFATNYQQKSQHTEDSSKVFKTINSTRDKMLMAMQKSLESSGVEVTVDLKNGVLRLPESLLFESGKWEPNKRGEDALNKLANVLENYLPCLANSGQPLKDSCKVFELNEPIIETVLIEGHTDKEPFHSENGLDGNWGLSAMRSISIFRHLIADQSALKNILNSDGLPILGISAYGSTRPIPNATMEQDRRIDIRFLMRSPTPSEIETIQKKMNPG